MMILQKTPHVSTTYWNALCSTASPVKQTLCQLRGWPETFNVSLWEWLMLNILLWKMRPLGGVMTQRSMIVPWLSHFALRPKYLVETTQEKEIDFGIWLWDSLDCDFLVLFFSRSLWWGSMWQMTTVPVMVDLEAERQNRCQELSISFHGQRPLGKRFLLAKDIAASKMTPLAVEQAFQTQSMGDPADSNCKNLSCSFTMALLFAACRSIPHSGQCVHVLFPCSLIVMSPTSQ